MQKIADRLKEARLRAKLSIAEVANKTKISVGNISELENDKYDPSAKALLLLSELYQVSIDWILRGETIGNNKSVDSSNEEFKGFLKLVDEAWEKSDEQTRGWIITQLKRAFPEIAEQNKAN